MTVPIETALVERKPRRPPNRWQRSPSGTGSGIWRRAPRRPPESATADTTTASPTSPPAAACGIGDTDKRFVLAEWRVDHRSGPQVSLLNIADIQRVQTPADGEKMVRRWRAMGPYMDAYIENLRLGLADGLVANRLSVQYAIEQLRMQLQKPGRERRP